MHYLATALTHGAGGLPSSRFRPTAIALLAFDKGLDLNFFLGAKDRFFKAQGQVIQEIITGAGSGPRPRRTAKPKREKVLKDIAERTEYIIKAAKPLKPRTLQPLMPVGIVYMALLRVVQDLVGLGRFLKVFLGFLVPRIAIGMIFEGQLPIGLLYLIFIGLTRDAQDLVIVSLTHASAIPPCRHVVLRSDRTAAMKTS